MGEGIGLAVSRAGISLTVQRWRSDLHPRILCLPKNNHNQLPGHAPHLRSRV